MQDKGKPEWRQVTHLSVRDVEKHAALRGDSFTHGIDCSCGSTPGQAGEYKYVQRYKVNQFDIGPMRIEINNVPSNIKHICHYSTCTFTYICTI